MANLRSPCTVIPSISMKAHRRTTVAFSRASFSPYHLQLRRQLGTSASSHRPSPTRRLKHPSDCIHVASTHSSTLKSGLLSTSYDHLVHADRVFDEMPHTANVVSWTSLISMHSDNGRPDVALSHFRAMLRTHVRPNAFTLSAAAKASSASADVATGTSIHAKAETMGFNGDVVLTTSLIGMYAKCFRTEDARKLFDRTARRNVVTWGAMIAAYARAARGHEALALFSELLRLRLTPNEFVLSSAVNACSCTGRLYAGRCIHAAITRRCHDGNDVVAGALVDMYANCGCIKQSGLVFRRIRAPTLVTYTSMIVSAAKHGLWRVALGLFDEMVAGGILPNEVTFLGVLHACSHSGLVDRGMGYLGSMVKGFGIIPCPRHYTCVVDMLGRAGRLDEAYSLSKGVRMERDDGLLLWTTLLSASRKHRRSDIAMEASKRLAEFDHDVAGAYVVASNAHTLVGDWENAVAIRREMEHRGIYKDRSCSWVQIRDDAAYVFYVGDISSSCGRRGEMLSLLVELEEAMRQKGYRGGRGKGGVFEGVEEEEKESVVIGMHSERLALAFGLLSTPETATVRVRKNLRICPDCHEAFKVISEIVGREFVVRDLNRFHHFSGGSCSCGDYW